MLSREGGWIRTRGGVDLHTASRRHVEPQQEDVEAMYRSRAAWLCSGFYSFTSSYVPRYYNIYIRYLNETLLAMENPHCKPVRDSVPVGFTEPLTRSRRKPAPARTGAVLHGNGYGLRGKTPGLPVTFPTHCRKSKFCWPSTTFLTSKHSWFELVRTMAPVVEP